MIGPRAPALTCPKTHRYAYNNGQWCCKTNNDCDHNLLTFSSTCCADFAYKECPTRRDGIKCKNHKTGSNIDKISNRELTYNYSYIWFCYIRYSILNPFNFSSVRTGRSGNNPRIGVVRCINLMSDSKCNHWASEGYCQDSKWIRFMERSCKAACNKC